MERGKFHILNLVCHLLNSVSFIIKFECSHRIQLFFFCFFFVFFSHMRIQFISINSLKIAKKLKNILRIMPKLISFVIDII